MAKSATARSVTSGGETRSKRPSHKLTYNDQRELNELTERIPHLERQRDRLADQLDTAMGDHARVLELSGQLAAAIEALDVAETRWLELTHKAESLETG